MLTLERRIALLRKAPAFSNVDEQKLHTFVQRTDEIFYPSGTIIVEEGTVGDQTFLILEGTAEVSTASPEGPVILAALSAGETFGELALFSDSGKRSATVTATSPTHLLSIPGADYRKLIEEDPEGHAQVDRLKKLLVIKRFLKLAASPFATLPQEQFQKLVGKLKPLSVSRGRVIIKQGELGDSCFILQSGSAEVAFQKADGSEQQIATLEPGAFFGEAALLTAAPRNATVRATEPCELLVLDRDDFLEVMNKDSHAGLQVRELLQMRARPKQVPGIEAVENKNAAGETIVILKDPERHTYYRLSREGWFIWELLDGEHTLKDLTMEFLREFKAFAPQAIMGIISGLTKQGFIQHAAFQPDVEISREESSVWQRFVRMARRVLEFQVSIKNVDRRLEQIYKSGFFLLYMRPVQILLLLLNLVGIGIFLTYIATGRNPGHQEGPWLLLWIFPLQIFSLFVHEAGHAFTTKACGREVHGIGVGWYWFGPVAFVDTSDVWLASRWQRIAVSIAGPYTNLIVGSFAAIGMLFLPLSAELQAILWQLVFISYAFFLLNLDPLLEYDGYYILTDLLDRPNLRQQALAWLGSNLGSALKNREVLRKHWFDVAYAIGSIIYILAMAAMTMFFYHNSVEHLLVRWIPFWVAQAWSWALGISVIVLSLAAVLGDLKQEGYSLNMEKR